MEICLGPHSRSVTEAGGGLGLETPQPGSCLLHCGVPGKTRRDGRPRKFHTGAHTRTHTCTHTHTLSERCPTDILPGLRDRCPCRKPPSPCEWGPDPQGLPRGGLPRCPRARRAAPAKPHAGLRSSWDASGRLWLSGSSWGAGAGRWAPRAHLAQVLIIGLLSLRPVDKRKLADHPVQEGGSPTSQTTAQQGAGGDEVGSAVQDLRNGRGSSG